MLKLLRFMQLLQKIDDDDFIHFVSDIIKSKDSKDLMRKLFWSYYLEQMHRHGDGAESETCIELQHHIDTLKQFLPEKEVRARAARAWHGGDAQDIGGGGGAAACAVSVDALPSELIAECGSYLRQQDYMHFSYCNREIYIALNSSFKLHELRLVFDNTAPTKWNARQIKQLKRVHSLHIKFAHYDEHTYNPTYPWEFSDSIQQVTLDNNEERIALYANNWNKVSHLALYGFSNYPYDYSFTQFTRLINNLSSLKELVLDEIELTNGDFRPGTLKTCFSSLVSLHCHPSDIAVDSRLCDGIIAAVGHQLQALSVHRIDTDAVHKHNFPKLKKLGLHTKNTDTFRPFKYVTTLEALRINTPRERVLCAAIDMIKTQKKLKRIEIQSESDQFDFVMARIQAVLFECRTIPRKEFYIGFEACDRLHGKVVFQLFQTLNTLKAVHVEQFMICVSFVSCWRKCDFETELFEMKQDYSVYVDSWECKEEDEWHIDVVISSKDCNINGHGFDPTFFKRYH